jgi:hypothetical protein
MPISFNMLRNSPLSRPAIRLFYQSGRWICASKLTLISLFQHSGGACGSQLSARCSPAFGSDFVYDDTRHGTFNGNINSIRCLLPGRAQDP